jgi:hypothetical protein
MTAIDTLGTLRELGYRLTGHCLPCAALYRKAPPDEPQPPSFFAIDLDAVIAELGRDQALAAMPKLPCPYCGSRRTEMIVHPPEKQPLR